MHHQPRTSRRVTPGTNLALMLLCTPLALISALGARLDRVAPARHQERGDVIIEHLGVILLSIVLLVALFAAMTTFGNDVMTFIRGQLGMNKTG